MKYIYFIYLKYVLFRLYTTFFPPEKQGCYPFNMKYFILLSLFFSQSEREKLVFMYVSPTLLLYGMLPPTFFLLTSPFLCPPFFIFFFRFTMRKHFFKWYGVMKQPFFSFLLFYFVFILEKYVPFSFDFFYLSI